MHPGRKTTHGALAAGDHRTVEAGRHALREGGNAVDAALAAGLTAQVVEPFLTSLGGGGVAIVRSGEDGQIRAHDFFGAVPGEGRSSAEPPPMTSVPVDYGVEVQTFHVGPASVAVPGIPAGFADLHERYGTLPWEVLAAPAIDLARKGFRAGGNLPVTAGLIAEVLRQDPKVAALYVPGDEPIADGTPLRMPDLADTLDLFAREGAAPFYRGEIARELLRFAGGDRGLLTEQDLRGYEAMTRIPLRWPYRDAIAHLSPPPGAGGALVAYALAVLERATPPIDAMTPDVLLLLARVMRAADSVRNARFFRELDDPAYLSELLSLHSIERGCASLAQDAGAPSPDGGVRSTTQISTVDREGWVVSYTSSNGESCGWMLPGTGMLINNFMGEDDLRGPGGDRRSPGSRIRTMMTPTVLQLGDGSFAALGSGGANRIRSAMMQGIVHMTDRGRTPAEAVLHPRIHFEDGICRIEMPGFEQGEDDYLEQHLGEVTRYPDTHMYFGGLHMARLRADGTFDGAGDPRRGGSYGAT